MLELRTVEEAGAALASFTKVVVTGATRAGTKITAMILADVLGLRYASEREVLFSDYCRIADFLAERDRFVLQCPAYAWFAPFLARADVAVVFVKRPASEVAESRARIRDEFGHKLDANREGLDTGSHATLKLGLFCLADARCLLPHAFLTSYGDFASHPLWMDVRAGWAVNQTSQDNA